MTTEKRPWDGGTGVTSLPPYVLPGDVRAELRYIHKIGPDYRVDDTAFFSDIETAIQCYLAGKVLEDQCSPRQVRKNLKKALKHALAVNADLNGLDGKSRQLLDEAGGEGYLGLHHLNNRIIAGASAALKAAEEFPNGGLPDFPAIDLCLKVADALEQRLGIRATVTREGPLETTMDVVLGAATGKPVLACHALVARALRCRREQAS
jgi:hypothetical protein